MSGLKIKNLSKSFNQNIVLKNINLELKKGSITALIGPSGSGKSTLLRCINALEIAQNGELYIDDLHFNYAQFKPKEVLKLRQKSAMVFQHFNLFLNKNALENVSEALIVVKKMPKKTATELAMWHLEQVGLKEKAKFYPYALSGGQAQRVAIARALALNPTLLLLDEPTSALDIALVAEVLEVIASIKNKTMILVTHELHFAKKIAEEIIFCHQGEILEKNNSKDFFEKPSTKELKQFLFKMKERESFL